MTRRRAVTIMATVTIQRPTPTPAEAARDAETQALIQGYLDIDMAARAVALETLLNTAGTPL